MSDPSRPPLWPKPIPIIGGTGKVSSGKSLFGLSICPGPETLVYDLEQSCASYESIGFERVDVQKEMQKWCAAQKPAKAGYKSIDLWRWWIAHVRALPANKYRVIMVDPVTDLEVGLTDYVTENPEEFGHTKKQYDLMSGIMWGDLKHYEKTVLADICSKCETMYFTAHVGAVFDGNKPTKELKAKGKESLSQLASLYLWFEREPGKGGARADVPSARVIKSRQLAQEFVDGKLKNYRVLPDRLPEATPEAIRAYFENPAGKRGATDAEKVKADEMSADERLRLETEKAKAEAELAAAKAEALAAAKPTVVLVPPAHNTPAGWENMFAGEIAAANSVAEINVIPGRIQACMAGGHMTAAEQDRLRELYKARVAAIQSQAA